MSFECLSPEVMLPAVEAAWGGPLTGLTAPLPSYINRVYELRGVDGTRIIGKFYRPGRWTHEALLDEHGFIADCNEAEVPVVAPLTLLNGSTLGQIEDIPFALFPKRAGRQLEINEESDWLRIGALVARIHLCGAQRKATHRITIHPGLSTRGEIEYLCDSIIPERFRQTYRGIATRLVDTCSPFFDAMECIRIHGDCHRGNILDRPGEGLMVIDFDDMAMGPPVQDLWLLLPDRAEKSGREIELFLQGYERFRRFDRSSLRMIEPLRAMRMIYFLAWVSRQIDDYQFRRNFPDWGSESFWQKEINDLREQMGFVMDAVG